MNVPTAADARRASSTATPAPAPAELAFPLGPEEARAHVADSLRRVAAYDDPAVWIHRAPPGEVGARLERAIARAARGEAVPLLGLVLGVKDNIDVAGMPTTAACPAFAHAPAESATVARKLIEAGAVVIGKTNLDQFATGLVGTRSPYGACRNVYDARYIAGGSSSGSAVAVAAGLVDAALGTDTAGSGRVPAAFNHLVGLKPTRGRLSTAGVVPACRSLDCVSVFARTVGLAERVADAAAGFDPADVYSRRPEELPARSADWARAGGGGFRFGVPADDQLRFFGNREVERLYRAAIDRAAALGGRRVEIDYVPFREAARLLYEGPWVAERLAAIRPLFERDPGALLPVTRQIIAGAATFSAVDAFEGQYRLRALRRAAEAEAAKTDVLLLPTAGTTYTRAEIEAEPLTLNQNLGYYTNWVNLLDWCALAVPAGFGADGLPAGVTFLAPAGADAALAALGRRFLGEKDNATDANVVEATEGTL